MDSLICLGAAMDSGLWLSDEIFDAIQKLNYLQYRIPEGPNERIRFGKQHYMKIANMRESLEKMLTLDMLNIHKVQQFLKAKRKLSRGFQHINLRHDENE